MPKRRRGDRHRTKHLYIILDDWLWGCSIRKIDLSSDYDYDDDVLRLPSAAFRLEVPNLWTACFTAAFGTKIMAMHPTPYRFYSHPVGHRCVVPVLDVRTRGLVFGPRPESNATSPIYISIGDDKVFSLSGRSFELLCRPQVEEPGGWARSWLQQPKPPFNTGDVTTYAVHPDGHTIFFSTKYEKSNTFTFHIGKSEWKLHGEWVLPFDETGCRGVHFDSELDAWVGLSGDPDRFGFICACDVASTTSSGQCPAWKISKENLLFSDDPLEEHFGATLVYMGHGNGFCLVQSVTIRNDENPYYDDSCYSCAEGEKNLPRRRFLLRVTTFSLKYDKNGELTTGDNHQVEPAELSLDLAKMSREIRGSPEILFAREVARACRMGNFIAFFRLARKASYLQACLMHAHFAQLRRQALASLHSGLQNGQGIPISHAVLWLAMEDEDIESLLEYHGFGLRQYEEPYLVNEGPFLNSESDFLSSCSQLVHSKKLQKIIDDVSSGPVSAPASKKDTAVLYSGRLATSQRVISIRASCDSC